MNTDLQKLSVTDELVLRGTLDGHSNWVTQVAINTKNPDVVVSCSRDRSLVVWRLTRDEAGYGIPFKRMYGHNHFVSDMTLSLDGNYALTGSWDKTLRLWDLNACKWTRRFDGHTKDVLSVAFSADNRQILSGSRDKTIKLWNTLGQCKYTIEKGCHSDWVSCVRFSPSATNPTIVSCGWDKMVKVWNLANCTLKVDHIGHKGVCNNVTISPDGSLCASGGKDSMAMLWDLNESRHLHTLEHKDAVSALAFSPNRYWLCVATGSIVRVWDLESKQPVSDLKVDVVGMERASNAPQCTCMNWSLDGNTLFTGYTDGKIRVWEVVPVRGRDID